jgi:hypothetical protein
MDSGAQLAEQPVGSSKVARLEPQDLDQTQKANYVSFLTLFCFLVFFLPIMPF